VTDDRDDLPLTTSSLIERLRADGRVPYVERGLLDRELGLFGDLQLLDDALVTTLLNTPSAVSRTIAASRLLEHVDAHVAREHPVSLEWHHDNLVVAEVPLGDGERDVGALRLVFGDGKIELPTYDLREATDTGPNSEVKLDPSDAESLAYALLRLVEIARTEENK
jgi:hypothetical protein